MIAATDRNRLDYKQLIEIQESHLAIWKERLRPALYADVAKYVRGTREQAHDESVSHRVYRGQDIVEIIMHWPALRSCYVPVPAEGDQFV